MAGEKDRIHTLTILLLKEGFTSVAKCLKSDAGLDRQRVEHGGKLIGELVVRQNHAKPPKWLAFFDEAPELRLPRLFNANNSAVFFVKRKSRLFAITFGYGRHLLVPGSWEEQFGLRVTLNTVDPLRLRSVDRKTFDAIAAHSRTQTSQAAGVAAFGLKVEQDLLCAATGEPLEKELGKRMTGMDSLTVAVPVRLGTLHAILDQYLVKFNDTTYRQAFPWIDHIGEVRDPTRRGELDSALIELLRHQDSSEMRAWLAVPDLIEWARVGGVRYSERRGDLAPDLHLRDFFETLRDRSALSLDTLKHRQAFAIDVEGDNVIDQWSIYECLYCELEHDETTFLLSGGKWYRIDRDFVGAVNRAVKKLVRAEPLPLPPYDDVDEGAYNQRAVSTSPKKLALLDRKLIRIGGTTIEYCDLLGTRNEMIHVKRYGGSSVLSHLFAQGTVAAQAFFQDAAFRIELNKRVPKARRLAVPKDRPDPSKYEVVYAIVSRSSKPIDQALPFFSRLNLRTAAKQLEGFGFRVSLVKIPVAAS
jgi:uncharacterized protein (TIGR04141 family)